jgi:hypothetical protein
MEQKKLVRISVRVRSGAASFRVGVQARSIGEALGLAGRSYPRGEVGVVFPAELRCYLDGKPAGGATELTHALAA